MSAANLRPRRAIRRPLVLAATLVALIKLAELAIDSTPLFWHDSGAFIYNALGLGFISERSWVYSLLVRLASVRTQSFAPLVFIQVAASGVTAWGLAFALVRYFQVRGWVAVLAACVFALDPTQIVHERLVMAETTTLLANAALLNVALEYLRTRRLRWLMVLALAGAVVVSLRVVYLPVVWGTAVLLPCLAHVVWPPRQVRACIAALLVATGTTFVLLSGYQSLTGWYADDEPAYHYRSGAFLAATVTPLLRPEDAADARSRVVIESQSARGIDPRPRGNRPAHLWTTGGLIDRLRVAFGEDTRAADEAARRMALHAIARDPIGFMSLGVLNYADHWLALADIGRRLRYENGESPVAMIRPDFAPVIETHFGIDVRDSHTWRTPSRRYHVAGRGWILFQFFSPFLALALVGLSRADARRGITLLAAWSWMTMGVITFLGIAPVFRYLHPLSFTGLIAAGLAAELVLARRPRQAPGS